MAEPMPRTGRSNVTSAVRSDVRKRMGDNGNELVEALRGREALGIEKYGTSLETFNGRRAAQDLYEELIDALQYCKQYLMEREAMEEVIGILLHAHRSVGHGVDFLAEVERAITLALGLEDGLPEYETRASMERRVKSHADDAQYWHGEYDRVRQELATLKNVLEAHAPLALREPYGQ